MAVMEFFLACFHGAVEGIKNFGLFIHTIASFNFYLLSYLFEFTSRLVTVVAFGVQETWYLVIDILANVGEFLLELAFCIRSLLTLLWKFVLLVWHALTFILASVEFITIALWTGLVVAIKTICQAVVDFFTGCTSTWLYGKGLVGEAFNNTIEGFSLLGSSVENLCVTVWNGVIGTIKHASHSSVDFVFHKLRELNNDVRYIFLDVFPNIPKEAYLGVTVCLLFYLILYNLPRLLQYMHRRGLTFPFLRGTGQRVANIIVNDSDDEFVDTESEVSDDQGDVNEDSDSVRTRGDDSADDSGTQTDDDSNYDSDHDIDIQLPPTNVITRTLSRCGLRQRTESPTLSTEQKANMSREDLEQEVEREKDKRACVVCQDRQKNVLILPCRHLCLCLQCANQIARAHFIDNRICPLCRTRIKTIMDIYV